VLTNFDGKRWFTPAHDQIVIFARFTKGQYRFARLPLPVGDFYPLRYTVMMEPVATDAPVFVAPRPETVAWQVRQRIRACGALRGNHGYLLVDKTGSLQSVS